MGAPRITPAQEAHFLTRIHQGEPIKRAAQEAGFSERAGYGILGKGGGGPEVRAMRDESKVPSPIPLDKLSDAAQEAMADRSGVLYCRRYFGYELLPWQVEYWRLLEDAWDSPDREFRLVNAPPGGGKSLGAAMFCTKLIASDRATRTLFISVAQKLARRNSGRVKMALQRVTPQVNKDGSTAQAALSSDFGRFKPLHQGTQWTIDEFTVEQMDGTLPEEKEPTCQSYGFDSRFIGNRLDAVFGDDMDTTRGIRNFEVVELNREVFDNELEPRLDAGGIFVLTQQRLGAFDFSAHVKAKMVVPDDYDGESELMTPQYTQITFKAHYEELCRGRESHQRDAEPWPAGCLLSPRNLSWADIRKAMTKESFDVIYQQQDPGESEALVQRIWVDGGRDAEGHTYLGCWDHDRAAWQLPPNLMGQKFGVVTVDPSPTRFWSVQAWVIAQDSEQRYLLDIERKKMEAPDFLDWSIHLNDWTGMAEDWRRAFDRAGQKLTHLIVERNAAQRFMLQYDHFHRWRSKYNIQVIAHDTARNKADEDFGVQMVGPRWRDAQVRLPGRGNDGRLASLKLVDEVVRYPHSPTDDCVMAQWFLEHNLPSLSRRLNHKPQKLWRPSWAPPKMPVRM